MRFLQIFLFALFAISTSFAQKEDYIWLFGYQSNQLDSTFGGTAIDFSANPPLIAYEYRDMWFSQVNASICDTAGRLLFYTNGIYVANAQGEPMENGEGLNPGELADTWQVYV